MIMLIFIVSYNSMYSSQTYTLASIKLPSSMRSWTRVHIHFIFWLGMAYKWLKITPKWVFKYYELNAPPLSMFIRNHEQGFLRLSISCLIIHAHTHRIWDVYIGSSESIWSSALKNWCPFYNSMFNDGQMVRVAINVIGIIPFTSNRLQSHWSTVFTV